MIRRIFNSIAFRAKFAYRRRLHNRLREQVLRLPAPTAPDKPDAGFEMLSFAGIEQLELMRQSFWSIGASWPVLPALRIVSDGSIDPAELKSAMAWWPRPVTAERWEAVAQRHADRGRPELAALAEKNKLGRKLAAVLDAGLITPTLFGDTDLLWFRGPPPLPSPGSAPVLKMAGDIRPSFDPAIFHHAGADAFAQPPFLNSGACFISGDVYTAAGLGPIAQWASQHDQYFTEQTLLIYACKQLGGDAWPIDQIYLNTDDAVRSRAERQYLQTAFARHYVGDVRHWFWRDVLALRQAKGHAG